MLGNTLYTVDFFGIAAIAAWAAPLFSLCWKDRRAALFGLIPLCFTAAVAFAFLRGIPHRMAISFAIGSYLSAAMALVLAANSVNMFRRSNPNSAQQPVPARRAA